MTDEQIRIKLAEWDGWTNITTDFVRDDFGELHEILIGQNNGSRLEAIPSYLNDLNACYSLEEKLDFEQRRRYADKSWMVAIRDYEKNHMSTQEDGWFIHLHMTARQRCEALLKTINMWE